MGNKENVFMEISQVEKISEYIKSPRKFIENFCYIVTKRGTFELFKLNKPQSKIMEYVEECLEKKKPIRIRILKARQMGFSTLISALGFWWSTMHENSSYAVVAHKEDSTVSIFDKNRIFYENLPKFLQPKTNRFNSEKISYDYVGKGEDKGLRSKIFFGTAGGNELFRGETILFLHKSEKAFWENVDILNKSLNAAVPTTPFSCIIDESTANGYNHYKIEWDKSKKGEDDYKPFFFGWNEMEEYQMEVEPGFKLLPIEEEYMLMHDLTMEQMRWRRYKILNDYTYTLEDIKNDDIGDFYQEYPLTDTEAFVASGRSVFNNKLVQKGLEYSKLVRVKEKKELESFVCSEKLEIYEYPEKIEEIEYEQKVEFNIETQEYEYVNTEIVLGVKYKYANYLLAIDTSGVGQDRNVISVWHTNKKKKVAQWIRNNISEEDLAKVSIEIAKYYNNGIIAPEVNYSHSLANFIEKFGYKRIYITENETRVDKKKETLEYGWKTTTITKPLLVSNMKKCLKEDYTICPDSIFWEEAEYYLQQKTPTNKDTFNAASGKHDDVVMSSMIGRYLCDSLMVNQGYTISLDKDLYENKLQKSKKNGIMIGEEGFYLEKNKKKNNQYTKGAFRNDA